MLLNDQDVNVRDEQTVAFGNIGRFDRAYRTSLAGSQTVRALLAGMLSGLFIMKRKLFRLSSHFYFLFGGDSTVGLAATQDYHPRY
jgi:hypothetical protein